MSLKKLLTALVTVSMVLTLIAPAVSADAASDLISSAVGRLTKFKIVQGDQNGDLHLTDTITRAETMKILVTAAGKADDAALLRGAPAFNDTQTHWASGYIALAKAMGMTIGYPDGSFRPDNKITYGEEITLIARLVGLDVSKQSYTWPNNYIHAAMDAGIIPPAVDATKVAGEFAIRSWCFVLLDQAALNVKLPAGKTLYQTYFVTTPPTLTVDQAPSLTTTKDSVTVSGSTNGTGVSINGSAVTLTAGTFSTSVKVNLGATTLNVVATDAVGNTTGVAVAVTRTAAAAATITVDLQSGNLSAGSAVKVNATVQDSYGSTIANAPVTGTCDATVGAFDGPSSTITVAKAVTTAAGKCTFTSGAATVSVTGLNVVAGALAKISINGTATMSSSGKQTFTIAGADANGNPVTAGNASWAATAGVIDQAGNFAPGGASGNVTITATSGSLTATYTVTVYGTAAAIKVTLSGNSLQANNASTATVTATVVDANGNTVPNFSGTISLISSNTTVGSLSSGSVAASAGIATTTVTSGNTVGSTVISASATGLSGGNVTLTTVAQALGGVTLKAGSSNLAADNGISSTSISAQLVDTSGNNMLAVPSAGVAVTIANSSTTAGTLSGTSLSFSGGSTTTKQSVTLTSTNNVGSNTISVTKVTDSNSNTLSVNMGSVTVVSTVVGVPYQLTIDTTSPALAYTAGGSNDTQQSVTVRVKDANGNQVTGITGTPSDTTPNTGTINLSANNSNPGGLGNANITGGQATFTVTDTTAETLTYTAKATVYANGTTHLAPVTYAVSSATGTGVFNPGPAAAIKITASPATVAVGGTTKLTATIYDSLSLTTGNNVVTSGTYAVTFHRTSSSPYVLNWSGDQTVNTVNGVASVNVTATNTTATDSFTAAATFGSNTSATTSAAATVTTTILGPSVQLCFSATSSPASGSCTSTLNYTSSTHGTAGTAYKVYVAAKDGNGNVNTADNSSVVTLTATDSNSNVTTYSATVSNGVATFSLNQTVSDTFTLAASASGLVTADGGSGNNGKATVTLDPAAAVGLAVSPTVTTFAADSGATLVKVTVTWVDKYGNTTNAPTTAPDLNFTGVTFTSSSSGAVTVATSSTTPTYAWQYCTDKAASVGCTTTGQASANSALFEVFAPTGAYGTATVSAKPASGSTMNAATATFTTYVAGSPAKLSIGAISNANAYGTGTTQNVKVSILDAGNNVVTGYAGTAPTLTSNGTASTITIGSGTLANGVYTFPVTDTTAETVTYTAALGALSSATAAGTFVPGAMDHVVVKNASPHFVPGNGSTVSTVTAKVTDNPGNTVASASGTMKFSFVSGTGSSDFAFFQGAASDGTLSVPVSNGVATVTLQTKNVTSSQYVQVQAQFTPSSGSLALTTGANPGQNTTALGVAYPNAAATTAAVSLSGTTGTVTFTGNFNTDDAKIASNYGVTVTSGAVPTISNIAVSGNTVTITLSAAGTGTVLTLNPIGSTGVRDWNGNVIASVHN